MSVREIKEAEWDEMVLSRDNIVAADFWATWCGPCRQSGPIFEEVSEDYPHIEFFTVNVDEEASLATKHGIRSIPNIKFFCSGLEVGEVIGYRPKEQLKQDIDKILSEHQQCIENSSKVG